MSPELLAVLRKWQASNDPVERAHARWRLSVTDQDLADAARAAQITAENPPQPGDSKPCCNG